MLNSRLLIVFSLLNLHLSILDFGLPVSFNHFFLKRRDHENDLQKVCECEGYCRLLNDYVMRKIKVLRSGLVFINVGERKCHRGCSHCFALC